MVKPMYTVQQAAIAPKWHTCHKAFATITVPTRHTCYQSQGSVGPSTSKPLLPQTSPWLPRPMPAPDTRAPTFATPIPAHPQNKGTASHRRATARRTAQSPSCGYHRYLSCKLKQQPWTPTSGTSYSALYHRGPTTLPATKTCSPRPASASPWQHYGVLSSLAQYWWLWDKSYKNRCYPRICYIKQPRHVSHSRNQKRALQGPSDI